jgi:ribosomal protein S12 methylthiotransferase
LGCSKNLVDSERLLRQLQANDFEFIHDPAGLGDFDTAIVNTCGFIGDAKKESIDTILRLIHAKKQRQVENVFVMGCLSERYKSELRTEIPEVDAFFGVNNLPEIIRHLGGQYRNDLVGERHLTTPGHYAYLKIAEGCDRHCSFCAIPGIRGPHASRPMEDILREAVKLAGSGVRELNLISQDTTYYGLDLYQKRLLPELMDSLANIKEFEWIRLHYTYPHGFPLPLLDVIRIHPNICKYIDIPLQHVSDRILSSMKRNIDAKLTRKLIEEIRKQVPGVAIRTTFIVGYPGETRKEFKELVNFIKENEFERVGVFPYSHEEGTHAFHLSDNISEKTKHDRVGELMAIQEDISNKINQKKVGTLQKIVVDRAEGGYFIGRSEFDSPEVDNEVLIPDHGEKLESGKFYTVRIVKAESFDLYAELS